jgi:ornithine decarboxylase
LTELRVNVNDFFSEEDWNNVVNFSERHETPFQLILTDVIKQKYEELRTNLPYAKVYYAVKANPAPEVITMLNELGSCFDVASIYELRQLLALGVSADRMSCGNTIKKNTHIKEFYEAGVRLFVTDSESDLRNIAKAAPGSKVFVRLLTEGVMTADWPLSRKFGCHPDMAYDLLVLAKKLGLDPYGLSFHVGSQQRDIAAWDNAIAKVKYLFDWVTEEGIKLKCINMGGGFPAHYLEKTNSIETYATEITRYLREDFGDDFPEIITEPGRSLVADSGVLVTEVVLIARKSRTALERWVYVDTGKFNGLMETLNESIKYPLYTVKQGLAEKCILAGPTCDSVDTLYEDYQYELPLNLAAGDRIYWLSTGAYTSSYSAVAFNGFPPLKTYVI